MDGSGTVSIESSATPGCLPACSSPIFSSISEKYVSKFAGVNDDEGSADVDERFDDRIQSSSF